MSKTIDFLHNLLFLTAIFTGPFSMHFLLTALIYHPSHLMASHPKLPLFFCYMSFLLGEYARVHVRDSYPFYHYSHATFIHSLAIIWQPLLFLSITATIFLSYSQPLSFVFTALGFYFITSHSLRSWSLFLVYFLFIYSHLAIKLLMTSIFQLAYFAIFLAVSHTNITTAPSFPRH